MDPFGDQPGEQQVDKDGRAVSRSLHLHGPTVCDGERCEK